MKQPKIIMTVIKEDEGYSAFTTIGKHFIATEGENIRCVENNDIRSH